MLIVYKNIRRFILDAVHLHLSQSNADKTSAWNDLAERKYKSTQQNINEIKLSLFVYLPNRISARHLSMRIAAGLTPIVSDVHTPFP
jgi:hypothetical protein